MIYLIMEQGLKQRITMKVSAEKYEDITIEDIKQLIYSEFVDAENFILEKDEIGLISGEFMVHDNVYIVNVIEKKDEPKICNICGNPRSPVYTVTNHNVNKTLTICSKCMPKATYGFYYIQKSNKEVELFKTTEEAEKYISETFNEVKELNGTIILANNHVVARTNFPRKGDR